MMKLQSSIIQIFQKSFTHITSQKNVLNQTVIFLTTEYYV